MDQGNAEVPGCVFQGEAALNVVESINHDMATAKEGPPALSVEGGAVHRYVNAWIDVLQL